MPKLKNLTNPLYAVILTVLGFLVFRLLLSGQAPDYATEISAAVFGGLLTIVITGVLLQKQSDVTIRQERNAKMLEAKLTLLKDLMDELKEILTGENIEKQVVAVQILSQRVTALSGIEVVRSFNGFAAEFARAAADNKLEEAEKNALLDALGKVSIEMRKDMLAADELERFTRTEEKGFREIATKNLEVLKRKPTTQGGFLEACSPEDRKYYEDLLRFLNGNEFTLDWGTVGFSTRPPGMGPAVLQCYPTASRKSLVILKANLPRGFSSDILARLESTKAPKEGAERKEIGLRTSEVTVSELCDLLRSIAEAAPVQTA